MAIGFDAIHRHEQALLAHATQRLKAISGLRLIGEAPHKTCIVSFVIDNPPISPLDIATQLALEGIAVRTGHHCCMPLMSHLGVTGTCRISMAFYNTIAEINRTADVLENMVRQRTLSIAAGPAVGHASTNQATSNPAASGQRDLAQDSSAASVNVSHQSSNVEFPEAHAVSPATVAEELADEFLMFDDRESKTQLLLEMGQTLPDHFALLKQMTSCVPGCMSEVYLIGRASPLDSDRLQFVGDSNAQIVRGLIALLQKLFSGQKAGDVLEFDLEAFFRQIGLDQFVTSQRRSGLAGMVKRIRSLAQDLLQSSTPAR
jgi:cysteine desulfurase/selenocysteine lyase